MAVIRVNKTANYTVMSNSHFREKDMSLKAKGLLSLMLSLPDTWDYSIAGLCAICVEKESAIKSTLDELKRFGYLKVSKLFPNETDSGRIEYVYDIFETPNNQAVEKQGVENLPLENQSVENPRQYNTNKSNTKKSNTNTLSTNKKKVSKAAENSFDSLIEKYSNGNEEIKALLGDWLKVRKAKRAAMTDRAIELNLQKLDRLAKESKLSVVDYLEEVIRRGWAAFFVINNFNAPAQQQRGNIIDDYRKLDEKILNGELF